MARSAYAQTGSTGSMTGSNLGVPVNAAQANPQLNLNGSGGGTLSMAEIFTILGGQTSPMDLVAARTGGPYNSPTAGVVSPDFQNAVGAEAATPDPNNPNYWASGQKIGVSRFQGTTMIPGRPLKAGEVMVDTTNLSGEALAHGTDRAWMSSHGYTALTRPDPDGVTRQVKWMKTGVYQQNRDLLAKGGYVPEGTGVHGFVSQAASSKLVSQDEIKGKANIGSMTNMSTPTHLLSALYALPQDDLITLQHKLWDGGYYQGNTRPAWGTSDDATKAAYTAAMQDALNHPNMTLDESIAAAAGTTMANRRAQRLSDQKAVDDSLAATRDASVDSSDTLRKNVRDTATTLLGRNVTPQEVDQLVSVMQGKEQSQAQETYNAQRKAKMAEKGILDDATLDRYVDQFQVAHAEQFPGTVGALGMRPREWGGWLSKLGMDPGTPFTAANERTVMKELAKDYYQQFNGNWQDVTTAMLSGPSAGWADISSGLAPHQPQGAAGMTSSSTNAKSTEITGRFLGSNPPTAQGATDTSTAATDVNLTERFDPTAYLEEQLRKQHPDEVVRHELTGPSGLSDAFSGMVSKWGDVVVANLAPAQIYRMALDVGFKPAAAQTMTAIIMAESGGNPGAHNYNVRTGDDSWGLAQVNMLGGMGPERRQQYGLTDNGQLADPMTNLRVAYGLSNGGTNFTPWTTYTHGKHTQYLSQVQSTTPGSGGGVAGGGGANAGAVDLAAAPPQTLGEKLSTASDVMAGSGPDVMGGAQAPGVFAPGSNPAAQQPAPAPTQATAAEAGAADTSTGPTSQAIKLAVETANKHTPYVWGGNSLDTGVDCSGFIQQVYKAVGINLPRVSDAQINAGQKVDPGQMQPGDILGYVYNNSLGGGATHVALYIGGGMMAEALHKGEPVHVVPLRQPQFVSRPVPGKTGEVPAPAPAPGAAPQQPENSPDQSVWGRLAAMSNAMGAMGNYDVGGPS